jgi:hypothetical protein
LCRKLLQHWTSVCCLLAWAGQVITAWVDVVHHGRHMRLVTCVLLLLQLHPPGCVAVAALNSTPDCTGRLLAWHAQQGQHGLQRMLAA